VLSETIVEGLKPYSIGEKLRALRLKKKMGLVELGKHTGLSPALLSKLERSKLFPTLPTLLRIALVFSVGLDHFFTDERKRHVAAVVRKSERRRFPDRPGTPDISYFFESLDYAASERQLSAYQAYFQSIAKEKIKPHSHAGVEFLHLLSGTLCLKIGVGEYELEPGDSIYFDSSAFHSYRKVGSKECSAVVVTVP
jgi:transcriptional regulator with XRE-family HTH domain